MGRIDHSTNDIKTKFSINGVISMWGQIADTSFISQEEANSIPLILFHSTADSSKYHRSYIKLEPSIISQYAEIYKTKGEKNKIVLENGHLFIIDEQNGFKAELYPESETDFFLRDDNIQFTFNKNKKGQVKGLTFFHRC